MVSNYREPTWSARVVQFKECSNTGSRRPIHKSAFFLHNGYINNDQNTIIASTMREGSQRGDGVAKKIMIRTKACQQVPRSYLECY
jgi:hypothetical protein